MFDLDQAIAKWRRQMAAGGISSAAVLDELESHLREEVEHLTRSGSETQPAFETAVQRIGPASALKLEFAKTNGASHRLALKPLIGCLGAAVFVLLTNAWMFLDGDSAPSERNTHLAAASLIAVYLVSLPHIRR